MRKSAALCTFVLFLLQASSVFADNKITWLEVDSPPFYITEGILEGHGYQSEAQNLIQEQLPQYTYDRTFANLSRHYELFRAQEQVCAVALYKTPEREELAYFSIPSFITFPGVLVIRKESHHLFDYKTTVSLAEALQQEKIVLGRSKNRSFGHIIDEIVDENQTDKNVFTYEGETLHVNFIEMLNRGRIDAMISLPEEVMYNSEQLGFREQLMTLEIEETISTPDGMVTYVACSKSPWGQETIQNINMALLKLRPTEKYRLIYERWLDDNAIERYRTLYSKYFLKMTE